MMQNWSNLAATECEDTNMPLRSLNPTSANSGVAARKPLGHVEYYAPALIYELRLALHHFSNV